MRRRITIYIFIYKLLRNGLLRKFQYVIPMHLITGRLIFLLLLLLIIFHKIVQTLKRENIYSIDDSSRFKIKDQNLLNGRRKSDSTGTEHEVPIKYLAYSSWVKWKGGVYINSSEYETKT